MLWITRAGARLDRAAMIWLIRRFIDNDAVIRFVPDGEVIATAGAEGGTAFHHPDAELRNTGFRTGFDSLIYKYELTDPALTIMALAIRGAETNDRTVTPWSAGLRAIGSGLRLQHTDDETFVAEAGRMLDGLYRFCQDLHGPATTPSKPGN